jgi:hypothetical protein
MPPDMEIAKRLTRIMRDVVRDLRREADDTRAPAVVLSYNHHLRAFLDDDDLGAEVSEGS